MVSPVEPAPRATEPLPSDWEQQIVRAYTIFNATTPAAEPEPPPVVASAAKWMEKLHPRNADGEFIDVRARLKPTAQAASASMKSMFTSWQGKWTRFGGNFRYTQGAAFNPFEVKVNSIFGWLRQKFAVRPVLTLQRKAPLKPPPPELAKQPVDDPAPTERKNGWKPPAEEVEYLKTSDEYVRVPDGPSPPKKGRVHTNGTKYRRKDGYQIEHHYDPQHYEGDGRWRVTDPEGNEIDYQMQSIEEVEALIGNHKAWKAEQDTKRQERAARKRAEREAHKQAEAAEREAKQQAWIAENRTSTDPLNRQIADILANPDDYTDEQVWDAKNAWDQEHSTELYDPTAMTEAYLNDFLTDFPEAAEGPDELAVLYEQVYQQMLVVSEELNAPMQGVIDVGDWLLGAWDEKMNPTQEEVLPEGMVRDPDTGLLIDTATGMVVDEDDDDEGDEPEEEWVSPSVAPEPAQPEPAAEPPSAPEATPDEQVPVVEEPQPAQPPPLPPGVEVRGDMTPAMQKHLDQLATLPTHIVDQVVGHGINTVVHSGPVSDIRTHLKGVTPRGWTNGQTWDDVPGSFNRQEKIVVLGEVPGGGHGSVSLALHEYGHAVDLAFGVVSKTPEYREIWEQIGWTHSYYSNRPDAGAEESFAELFAMWNIPPEKRMEYYATLGRTSADAALIAELHAVIERAMQPEPEVPEAPLDDEDAMAAEYMQLIGGGLVRRVEAVEAFKKLSPQEKRATLQRAREQHAEAERNK